MMAIPRKDLRILLVYPNVMLQNTIPISISLLSATLKAAGFKNVKLFDSTLYRTQKASGDEIRAKYLQLKSWNFDEAGVKLKEGDVYDDFEQLVADYDPHIIASTMVENTWRQTVQLLTRVRSYGKPTLIGGVCASLTPNDVISLDCVDMICVGEGEQALVELCDCLCESRDYTSIKNLWCKTPTGIVKNSIRPISQLEDLPYLDFTIYEEMRFFRPQRGKVVKMLPIETTRGCPYNCTFCCASSWRDMLGSDYYRTRSVGRCMDEVQWQREKHGMEHVYFSSETFLAMPDQRFEEFVTAYTQIDLPFWFQTRPETICEARFKRIEHLDFRLSMGIESGNEKLRRGLLNRNVSNNRILEATHTLNKLGVSYSVNNMIGFPSETRQEIFDTIELNRACHVKDVNCFLFVPYRGTKLHALSAAKGYISPDHIAHEHTQISALQMPQISADELYGLFKTFPLYVKLPKKYWPQIERAEQNDNEGVRMYNELAELYQDKYAN